MSNTSNWPLGSSLAQLKQQGDWRATASVNEPFKDSKTSNHQVNSVSAVRPVADGQTKNEVKKSLSAISSLAQVPIQWLQDRGS